MKISFYGHAATILSNQDGEPVIATDPWLVGSCYWRSWWLERPPTESQFSEFKRAKYIYVTHEHPDHFHFPSIRLIGKSPTYLFADQSHKTNFRFLKKHGFKAKEIQACQWTELDEDIKIMSIPNWNDDSCILILTPSAAIINMNDSRFSKRKLKKISALLDQVTLPRVLCQSYSPASFIFNFFHEEKRLTVVRKQRYIDMALDNCKFLRADFFVPFASQNIFLRDDSSWANDFKVTYSELKSNWSGTTELLPPYCTLLLDKDSIKTEKTEKRESSSASANKAHETERENSNPIVEVEAVCKALKQKFDSLSLIILLFFPRGMQFRLDSRQTFIYFPFSRSAKLLEEPKNASISFHTSAQPFSEALKFNTFNDLSISMFTKVTVKRKKIDPLLVYFLFVLIEFSDHGHFDSFSNFFRFIRKNFRRLF